jgi:hypothetical protein
VTFARGRLAAVSVRTSLAAGGWVGFALGVVVGAMLGAALSWFAGSILSWQRELGLTLGVSQSLLPFGAQLPVLRWLSANWYIVVPMAALLTGAVAALVGGIIGGLLAAAYNRSPRHASVVIELPDARLIEESAPGHRDRNGRRMDIEGGPGSRR